MTPSSLSALSRVPVSVAARPPLTVIDSTVDHAIGVCGNVALYVWRRITRSAALPAISRAFVDATGAGGGRFGNFGVIEAEASLPEAEMRARLARVMRDASASMDASALVFEGTGFRAAAVRTAAMGLALMARQPYPHRVLGMTQEGADWLVAQMIRRGAPSPSAETIEAAMQELRRAPAGRVTP